MLKQLATFTPFTTDTTTLFYTYFGRRPATFFRDKVVWIVQANTEVGRALAVELAGLHNGLKIVLSDQSEKYLEETKVWKKKIKK